VDGSKKNPPKITKTKPVTVRLSVELIELIDGWHPTHPGIPSRGDFLREAAEEKLAREKLRTKKP
jgi:hypothetical protein